MRYTFRIINKKTCKPTVSGTVSADSMDRAFDNVIRRHNIETVSPDGEGWEFVYNHAHVYINIGKSADSYKKERLNWT